MESQQEPKQTGTWHILESNCPSWHDSAGLPADEQCQSSLNNVEHAKACQPFRTCFFTGVADVAIVLKQAACIDYLSQWSVLCVSAEKRSKLGRLLASINRAPVVQ